MVNLRNNASVERFASLEAENIQEQLELMETIGDKGRVVWIRSKPTFGTAQLSMLQRFCIWVAGIFNARDHALRYFVDYDHALNAMKSLGMQVATFAQTKPELAIKYMHCCSIFQKTFGTKDPIFSNIFLVPSVVTSPPKPVLPTTIPVTTPAGAITGNTEALPKPVVPVTVTIPADAITRDTEGSSTSGVVSQPPLSVEGILKLEGDAALTPGYDEYSLATDFLNTGLLAQGLWLIQQNGLNISLFNGRVSHETMQWLKLQSTFKTTSKTPLDAMALNTVGGHLGMGWGYKSANLTRLQAHAESLTALCGVCDVEIPAFLPLGDFEMRSYIVRNYPELFKDWQDFLDSFSASQRANYLADKKVMPLSDLGVDILAKMRKRITGIFTDVDYTCPQLQEWIAKQNPEFVIVRSTGKEDSDTNSNAGGNASIPFVKPNAKDISKAIGEVIASYFDVKSIKQRITAGDPTLFTEEPFMPVLIQNMIGESVGGVGTIDEEVPRSGVMFTCSAGKAQGLTEFAVGLGNNEGVVTSSVSVDRYLLDTSGGVTRVVQSKDTRYVAVQKTGGKFACEPIVNRSNLLRNAPALPDSVAHDMKIIADYLSAQYADKLPSGAPGAPKPLDIEFTIKMNSTGNPVIYLLQARPLVPVKKEQEPSYIDADFIKTIEAERIVKGKSLLDGGAYVRTIHSKNEIIVCDTIGQALHEFQTTAYQEQVKTVVIRKPAPGTSHEAVMLRSKGVAVLVVENMAHFTRVETLLDDLDENPMLVDLQRGIAVSGKSSFSISPIKLGYTCYPIPLEYSMKPSSLVSNLYRLSVMKSEDPKLAASAAKKMKHMQDRLNLLIAGMSAQWKEGSHLLPTGRDGYSLRDLLDIMGTKDKQQAKLACATLLDLLRRTVFSKEMEALPRSRLELLTVLENIMDLSQQQFSNAVKAPAKSLERLYPVRLIEACLFQTGEGLQGGLSFSNALAAIKNQQIGLQELKSLYGSDVDPETLLKQIPLLRVEKVFVNKEVAGIWKAITAKIQHVDGSQVEMLLSNIMSLDQLGVLTDVVNAKFAALFAKHEMTTDADVSQERVNACINELVGSFQTGQEDLAYCQNVKSQLVILKSQMSSWSLPEYVVKQVPQLAKTYEQMGLSRNPVTGRAPIVDRYKNATPIARLAILGTLVDAVRTYDDIIKACTGSTEYATDKEKAIQFRRLLVQYNEMMRALLQITTDQKIQLKFGTQNLDMYTKNLDQGLKYKFGFHIPEDKQSIGFSNIDPTLLTPAQCTMLLNVSEDFNVSSATLGCKADVTCCATWPNTLEEYFTVFHQNMETALGQLKIKEGFSKDVLPAELLAHVDLLIKKMGGGSVSSIDVRGTQISVNLNIPLRQHAAKVVISQDLKHPSTMRTRVEMFGNPEHGRWEMLAGCACGVGNDLPNIHMDKPEIKYDGCKSVAIEFETTDMSDVQKLAVGEFLGQMSSLSMQRNKYPQYLEAVHNIRLAFGAPMPGSFIPTPANMLQGGFILATPLIDDWMKKGEVARAEELIAMLANLRKMHPWLAKALTHEEHSKDAKGRIFFDECMARILAKHTALRASVPVEIKSLWKAS